MPITGLVRYVAYVVATSLLNSLVILLAVESLGPGGGRRDATDAMMFLPMALTIVPYVVLQVVVAALVIRPLSLWKLFVVSAAFLLGGSLLAAGVVRVPWTPFRWIGTWLFSVTGRSLALLVPVAILALAARRRSAVTTVPPSDSVLPGTRELPTREFKWRWYYWDISLAVIILWLEIIVDPWGVFNYLGGLINVPFSQVGFMLSVTMVPWTLLCPVVLLVRMLVIWPRRLRDWRRMILAWGIVGGALVVMFILPFLYPIARPREAFMAGFEQHVRWRVDIPAVQEWLAMPKRSQPPRCVARLNAWGWGIETDDAGRPRLCLTWGSGVMGAWGLVVGDREMETPASDYSRYGEVRETIAPGAYIWYDVE